MLFLFTGRVTLTCFDGVYGQGKRISTLDDVFDGSRHRCCITRVYHDGNDRNRCPAGVDPAERVLPDRFQYWGLLGTSAQYRIKPNLVGQFCQAKIDKGLLRRIEGAMGIQDAQVVVDTFGIAGSG